MKIAFRHVPFDGSQRAELEAIARKGGLEPLWLGGGDVTAEDLVDCEVLMGYFPPDVLKSLPKLRWVQTPAAGVEKLCGNIYATDDVILTNGSGAFGVDISEYVVAGILQLFRHLRGYDRAQQAHKWGRAQAARSIYGSTCCVIGCGNVGKTIANRLKALGASCVRGINITPDLPSPDFDEAYVEKDFAKALAGADIVTTSLPLTAATRGFVSADFFAAMDKDAVFVNVGRGATVDEEALAQALASGAIAGAVVDVFQVEPLPTTSPLWDMQNVVLTPHVAGWDDDLVNVAALFGIFKENLTRYIEGRELTHVVDRTRGY